MSTGGNDAGFKNLIVSYLISVSREDIGLAVKSGHWQFLSPSILADSINIGLMGVKPLNDAIANILFSKIYKFINDFIDVNRF